METEDTAIFIQARTGSTRLPNKILLPFYQGKSILDILLENLLDYKNQYKLILCTSTEKGDDVLENYATKHNVLCFRGSEHNVLDRFVQAADELGAKNIVRVCADNPFLDKEGISYLVSRFKDRGEIDYCSFKNKNGLPVIKTHIGLFAEVVKVKALKQVLEQTTENLFLEHVTNFIYGHPNKFKVDLYPLPAEVLNNEFLRFTVDDQDDFDNLSLLYDRHIKMGSNILRTIEYVLNDENHLNAMKANIKKYSK